jgi:hypothetical protein
VACTSVQCAIGKEKRAEPHEEKYQAKLRRDNEAASSGACRQKYRYSEYAACISSA